MGVCVRQLNKPGARALAGTVMRKPTLGLNKMCHSCTASLIHILLLVPVTVSVRKEIRETVRLKSAVGTKKHRLEKVVETEGKGGFSYTQ